MHTKTIVRAKIKNRKNVLLMNIKHWLPNVLEFFSLYDPVQSSAELLHDCVGNKCTADKAIDDNLKSAAITTNSRDAEWWSATIPRVVRIGSIMVFASCWALGAGYYSNFTVETRLNENDEWGVCKGPYSMTEPCFPHILQCNAPTTLAKYIRLSTRGPLYLFEVKVTGTTNGKLVIWLENCIWFS